MVVRKTIEIKKPSVGLKKAITRMENKSAFIMPEEPDYE